MQSRRLHDLFRRAATGPPAAGKLSPVTGSLDSLALGFPLAFLANRCMIARGRGHAVVHGHH